MNEPVAWMETYCGEPNNLAWTKEEIETLHPYNAIPLYANSMRELTDEEIEKIGRENLSYWDSYDEGLMLFAKEIQKYMKDKK